MGNKIQDVNKLFEKINKDLSTKFKGKIVAIDTESGKYFIGSSEIDAYKKAAKRHPNKQFIYKRIGFESAHFVGAI